MRSFLEPWRNSLHKRVPRYDESRRYELEQCGTVKFENKIYPLFQ